LITHEQKLKPNVTETRYKKSNIIIITLYTSGTAGYPKGGSEREIFSSLY